MNDSENNNLLGQQIIPPDNPGTWIGRIYRGRIARALTCLLNPRIIVPVDAGNGVPNLQLARVTMGPNGWTAILPTLAGISSYIASSVPFSGNGPPSAGTLNPAGVYITSPIPSLYVDMTAKALYVCTVAGTSSTSVWAQISSGGTAASPLLQQFKFVSDGGDYILAKAWDGTTLAANPTYIAKPYKLRCSITTETDTSGTVHTFTYSPSIADNVAFYTRTDSYSSTSETQVIVPAYLPGDLIYAGGCQQTVPSFTILQSASIAATGAGYVLNDILTVVGGSGTSAQIKVTAVIAGGVISAFSIINPGKYSLTPSITTANPVSGGSGTAATFNLTFTGFLIDLNLDGRAWAH